MARPDRMLALYSALTGKRAWTLRELAEKFETSERTIYRDLANLEKQGFNVVRGEGTYRLEGSSAKPLELTDRERLFLTVALSNPSIERQRAFHQPLKTVRAKLAAVPSKRERRTVVLAGPERSGPVTNEVVAALESAIEVGQSVSMEYTSLTSGKREWRNIDPWALIHRSEAWYLIGRCHRHDEPRTFRLDRISSVLNIGATFDKPERFDPEEWFRGSWGATRGEHVEECVIVFDRSVAALVENATHHDSETKTPLANGDLEYRVDVAPNDELARWVVGFGGAARAVAPDPLVQRVRRIAAEALAAHEGRLTLRRSAQSVGRGGRTQATGRG